MGRPRTGSVERRPGGTWAARVTLKDGSRSSRIDLRDAKTEAQAKAFALALQAAEDKGNALFLEKLAQSKGHWASPEGTVDAWWSLYIATKQCGEGHRRVERSSWKKWISPTIGHLPMATLRPEDVERVRDKLDAAIDAGETSSGTAENVWSTLTTAMTAATNAKDRALRVHLRPRYPAPVHAGILPPRGGNDRERPWLYPNEWVTLASCQEVPEAWRRIYAIALYTGLRPNELRVLTWDDVELAAGLVRVAKAWDVEARAEKAPKTRGGHRVVPLRPEIRALLTRPPGVSGRARVVTVSMRKIAERFRAHLRLAGVRRPRLFARSATEIPIDFRALRDSYATWRALEGTEAYALRRELGHESLETTDRYIKAAGTVRSATLGVPFPPFSFARDSARAATKAEETTMKDGSDCRTRTWESDEEGAQAREISGRSDAQTPTFGAVVPGFCPRLGEMGGPLGYEAGLYDVLERAIVACEWPAAGDA